VQWASGTGRKPGANLNSIIVVTQKTVAAHCLTAHRVLPTSRFGQIPRRRGAAVTIRLGAKPHVMIAKQA